MFIQVACLYGIGIVIAMACASDVTVPNMPRELFNEILSRNRVFTLRQSPRVKLANGSLNWAGIRVPTFH
jgi:hypothetical protein